jgi:hypothetical protein
MAVCGVRLAWRQLPRAYASAAAGTRLVASPSPSFKLAASAFRARPYSSAPPHQPKIRILPFIAVVLGGFGAFALLVKSRAAARGTLFFLLSFLAIRRWFGFPTRLNGCNGDVAASASKLS